MKRIVTIWTFLFGLAGSVGASGPTTVLSDDAIVIGPERLAPLAIDRAVAERWLATLEAGDAASAIDEGQAQRDPVRFEQAATQVVEVLRRSAPSAAGRQWLQWLATQPPRVWQRHEETAADAFVPVFALDQRATGTLQLWERAVRRDRWLLRFATSAEQAIADLLDAGPEQLAAATDAIGTLDDAALQRLSAALARHAAPVELSLAVAQREPDVRTLRRVIADGTQTQQLAAIALAARLSDDDTFTLLGQASADRALASAATLALADLAPRHPPAMKTLAARLDDPALGSSAAAALARLPADDRVAIIERMMTPDVGATKAAHLVLALRLEGSPAARRALDRWRHDARVPEPVRRELER